jgi:hypothetical protein
MESGDNERGQGGFATETPALTPGRAALPWVTEPATLPLSSPVPVPWIYRTVIESLPLHVPTP